MHRPPEKPMRAPTKLSSLSLLATLLATTAVAAPETKIASIEALPAAVQKTVRAESAGATIRGMTKETDEHGKIVYEVEMMVKGLSKDINVGEDGTVMVSEQQVTLDALSPAV